MVLGLKAHGFGLVHCLMRTPQPVIVTITDNKDYTRVLSYCFYTTVTGWGDPPKLYLRKYGSLVCKVM